MRGWRVLTMTVLLGLAAGTLAAPPADLPPPAREAAPGVTRLDGQGSATGRGWRRAVNGIWYGTGDNTGQTWRQDVTGTWRGGGTASGQRWRPGPRAR